MVSGGSKPKCQIVGVMNIHKGYEQQLAVKTRG